MSYITRRLFTRASAIATGVGATAGALMYWRSFSWGKSKRVAVVSLSAEQFNALQNQQLLQDALLPTHLPWSHHAAQKANISAETHPSVVGNQRSLLHQTFSKETSNFAYTNKNIIQDDKNSKPNQTGYQMILYRLLGCPYCAKVQALLNFYDVPYNIVQIDPINGRGIPDPRYTSVPQIKFVSLQQTHETTQQQKQRQKMPPNSSYQSLKLNNVVNSHNTNYNKESSKQEWQASHLTQINETETKLNSTALNSCDDKPFALLVDSASIISAFGKPLGYENDLHNPHIIATREWITNHFQGASFAIVNGNMSNAMKTHTFIVPNEYQRLYHRILGAMALNILVRMKVKPRLLANLHPFNKRYETVVLAPSNQTFADIARKSPIEWLNVQLNIFLSRRPQQCVFHGGDVPDLADIEMYGVTRVVDTHPTLRSAVRNSEFGEWQSAMQKVMLERNKHL